MARRKSPGSERVAGWVPRGSRSHAEVRHAPPESAHRARVANQPCAPTPPAIAGGNLLSIASGRRNAVGPDIPSPEPDRHTVRRRSRVILAILSLGLVTALAIWLFAFNDPEELLARNDGVARVLFLLIIITEVIVAPIPGGVIAFLAAAHFGVAWSWPIQYLGNVIGGASVFLIARSLGASFVERNVPKGTQERYNGWLTRHPGWIWIFYALPVFPIDTISILLSLTRIQLRTFLLVLVTALPSYTGITAFAGARFGAHVPYIEYVSLAFFILFLGLLAWFFFGKRSG